MGSPAALLYTTPLVCPTIQEQCQTMTYIHRVDESDGSVLAILHALPVVLPGTSAGPFMSASCRAKECPAQPKMSSVKRCCVGVYTNRNVDQGPRKFSPARISAAQPRSSLCSSFAQFCVDSSATSCRHLVEIAAGFVVAARIERCSRTCAFVSVRR